MGVVGHAIVHTMDALPLGLRAYASLATHKPHSGFARPRRGPVAALHPAFSLPKKTPPALRPGREAYNYASL